MTICNAYKLLFDELNEENSTVIIERYIKDLQENNSMQTETTVKRSEVPEFVNKELDNQSNN